MFVNKLSFGSTYKFLQNQQGLHCAYCGKPIISEKEIDDLCRQLQTIKGQGVAEVLTPYLPMLKGKRQEFLQTILDCAKQDRFQDWTFKRLSILGASPNIYTANPNQTMKNLFRDIRFSVEHINPRMLDGKNEKGNYLPMHISCNECRDTKPYTQLAQENPFFVDNIVKSLSEINGRILSDRAGRTHYSINLPVDYVERVKANLSAQGLDIKGV